MPLPPTPNIQPPKHSGGKKNRFGFSLYWMYAFVTIFLIGIFYLDNNDVNESITFSKLEETIEGGGVKKIIVNSDKRTATAVLTDSAAAKIFNKNQYKPGEGTEATVTAEISSADRIDKKIDTWRAKGQFTGEVEYEHSSGLMNIVWSFGPIILLVVLWIFIMKRMSGGGGGGSADLTTVNEKTKALVEAAAMYFGKQMEDI